MQKDKGKDNMLAVENLKANMKGKLPVGDEVPLKVSLAMVVVEALHQE